jgi:hypothetical protein
MTVSAIINLIKSVFSWLFQGWCNKGTDRVLGDLYWWCRQAQLAEMSGTATLDRAGRCSAYARVMRQIRAMQRGEVLR